MSKWYKGVMIFLGLFVSNSILSQHYISLQPDNNQGKDAYVSSINPDKNFGDSSTIETNIDFVNGQKIYHRFFLNFDLDFLPSFVTIDSAFLTLHRIFRNYDSTQLFTGNSYLMLITSDWDENQITWNNQPNYDTTEKISLELNLISKEPSITVNITNFIKSIKQSPEQYYGIVCILEAETPRVPFLFASSDYTEPSKRPQLDLHYSLETTKSVSSQDDELTINTNFTTNQIILTYPTDDTFTEAIKSYDCQIYTDNGQLIFNEKIRNQHIFDLNHIMAQYCHILILNGKEIIQSKMIPVQNY